MKNIGLISFIFLLLIACNKNEVPTTTTTTTITTTLEKFADLDQAAGNIAYTDTGDLVFSYHPFFDPVIRVARYDATAKTTTPFPNQEWNTVRTTDENYLNNVLGIRSDAEGIIWILDMGTRAPAITAKLVGWNTKTDKLEHIYKIPAPSVLPTSQPQDLVIDNTHKVFVIADEDINGGDGSKAALIVIKKDTETTRRVLQGHYSTRADRTKPLVVNGKTLGDPIYVGVDGITLDKNDEWLYYAPLNGSKVYRLKMENLINESLTDTQLGGMVETYSDKNNNGGISIDVNNNLYLTNLETHSVGFVSAADKTLSVLTSNSNMQWPDGLSYNKDGYMYISASQVHLGAAFNDGTRWRY